MAGAKKDKPMNLKNQKKIEGARDNANVCLNENGTVYVGSITLDPGEPAQFLALLGAAFAELGVIETPKTK
jgi:hypothetical protein